MRSVVAGSPLLEYLSFDSIDTYTAEQKASWRKTLLNSPWPLLRTFQIFGLRGIDLAALALEPPYSSSLMEEFIRRHRSLETLSIPYADEVPRLKTLDVSSLALEYVVNMVGIEASCGLTALGTGEELSQVPNAVQNVLNLIGLKFALPMPYFVTGVIEKPQVIPLEPLLVELKKLRSLKYFSLHCWEYEYFPQNGLAFAFRNLAERTTIEYLRISDSTLPSGEEVGWDSTAPLLLNLVRNWVIVYHVDVFIRVMKG
ncbi:hypothetical protein M422DRAFT_262662 [Sphaerobolus stellatus SS14]|uniref:Uncharacterized protein n=1 Tax=Sphaerobolus stellatus (strain SS14) TaxID=990650 RepID=A0A0C9VCM8_SPHS4|nr:hypothetical protein M422DRAFT_262662 [Sphaerobolus stellatus SS14]